MTHLLSYECFIALKGTHFSFLCAHVNLCHFFSSSWCRWLAAASAFGFSWTFLFTFFLVSYGLLTEQGQLIGSLNSLKKELLLKYSAHTKFGKEQTGYD